MTKHTAPVEIGDPKVWSRQIIRQIRDQPYDGEKVEWYGQANLMKQIDPFIQNDDPFPHMILLGEPGLGKSHLAKYVAFVRNEVFEETTAPIDPMSMPIRGVLLLDEVHRQRSPEPCRNR